MKKALQLIITVLFLTGVFLYPASAITTTLDFDSILAGTEISGPGVFPDVEFSKGAENIVVAFGIPSDPPFSRPNTAEGDPFSSDEPFRADFLTNVNFVSVLLGDNGFDSDSLFLKAFSSSNSLLSMDTAELLENETGGYTLSVNAPQIEYVVFGSTGVFPNSIDFDNFTYTKGQATDHGPAVPEPSSLLLIGTGLGGLAAWRYKKSVSNK